MPRGVGVRVPLSALGFEDEQRKLLVFFCAHMFERAHICPKKGLLVKLVHKIGAVFIYWSKIVHKCGYLPAFIISI